MNRPRSTEEAARVREEAQRILRHAKEKKWARWQTVAALEKQCDVSLLRAHRWANDWTAEELCSRIKQEAGLTGTRMNHLFPQRVYHWEQGERPSVDYLDLLCRVFRTRPDLLGFGTDHTPIEEREPPVALVLPAETGRSTTARRMFNARRRSLAQALDRNAGMSVALLQAVTAVRRVAGYVVPPAPPVAWVQWEDRLAAYAEQYAVEAPARLLGQVATDLNEVEYALNQRLSGQDRLRGCRLVARLSALGGMLLGELGQPAEAQSWLTVARRAADEDGDSALRAWTAAVEAAQSYAAGDRFRAMATAGEARKAAGDTGTVGAVLAHVVQARVRAMADERVDVLEALRRAEEGFGGLPERETSGSWLGYPRGVYLCQRGEALRQAGLVAMAREACESALFAHRLGAYRFVAAAKLELAWCDIADRKPADACRRAALALRDLPTDHRTPGLLVSARELLAGTRAERHAGELATLLSGA